MNLQETLQQIDADAGHWVIHLMDFVGEFRRPVSEWIHDIGACPEAWFVSGMEDLKAIALAESPAPFRLRKIFVLENFLSRA